MERVESRSNEGGGLRSMRRIWIWMSRRMRVKFPGVKTRPRGKALHRRHSSSVPSYTFCLRVYFLLFFYFIIFFFFLFLLLDVKFYLLPDLFVTAIFFSTQVLKVLKKKWINNIRRGVVRGYMYTLDAIPWFTALPGIALIVYRRLSLHAIVYF